MELLLEENLPDDNDVSAAALRFYYENLFPFESLQRWLSYSNNPSGKETAFNDPLFLSKREVCLTCRRGDAKDEEFFMRWQSFSSFASLKDRVLSMNDLCCHKLDFGGVYSLPVSQRETHGQAFKPQQKELVFDLDMNDYDDVRTCCKGKRVCKMCWLFLAIAARLLDAALKSDFGFKHVLWVFSGRRGLHAWVCDTDARLLPNESRGQLTEYLNICTGSDQQGKKINLWGRTQHPAIERAFSIAYAHFHQLLVEQDLFFAGGGEQADKLLEYLPASPTSSSSSSSSSGGGYRGRDAAARSAIELGWLRGELSVFIGELKAEKGATACANKIPNRSVRLFERMCSLSGCPTPAAAAAANGKAASAAGEKGGLETAPNFIKEIVLAIAYPRLDINVSKDIGHLLKSPFCIHQGTGKVCVPIDLSQVENFDPLRVPTLSFLRKQFDDPSRLSLPPKDRTALRPFLEFFTKSFLAPLEQSNLQELKCTQPLDATSLVVCSLFSGHVINPMRGSMNGIVRAAGVVSIYVAVLFLVLGTLIASILRIQKTSSSSAFSTIGDAALDLLPGVAFLHSMQVFEETGTKEWTIRLSPLSMESRRASETEYRLSVYDEKSPQRSSSSSSNNSSSTSSSSTSSSNFGTCKLREAGETVRSSSPWKSMDESLAALASLFEQQMKRRVSRRMAAAAEKKAADAAAVPANATKIPVIDTTEFTLTVHDATPIPASFSWLFRFTGTDQEKYCLLLNTLYSAFSDKENDATLFLTSSETDFHNLAGLLHETNLLHPT
ncbi:hypothetical protein Esti_000010 [Eimeria stiedai]